MPCTWQPLVITVVAISRALPHPAMGTRWTGRMLVNKGKRSAERRKLGIISNKWMSIHILKFTMRVRENTCAINELFKV